VTQEINFLKNFFPDIYSDRILIVGGTVRDMLLGRKSQDIDLVASLSHDELLAFGFHLVKASSSVTVYFKRHDTFGKIEVTRINSMYEIEDDLLRRDFTINAMAMDLGAKLIDPLGGEKDLREGTLRACSNHSFSDDPLRVFRAFRFEADAFQLTPETAELIRRQEWLDSSGRIPMERFSNEMLKALERRIPERFFERMIEFNVGTEFIPELFRMPHIPAGPLEHHPEGDLFSHSLQTLQRVASTTKDPLARFCAFFHDLGKLATDPALYPKHHGHDDAGFAMASEFCLRLCLPARYRKALAWVNRLHGKANMWEELRDSTKIKTAEQAIKAGVAKILPLISTADKADVLPITGWYDAIQIALMSTQELGIDLKKLESMHIKSRPSYILQKRVDAYRYAHIHMPPDLTREQTVL